MSSTLVARRGFIRMLASIPVIAAVGSGAAQVVERAKEELQETKTKAVAGWKVARDASVLATATIVVYWGYDIDHLPEVKTEWIETEETL